MIEDRADKAGGVMTHTAVLGGADMPVRFADCEAGIVAGRAIVDDAVMAKGRRQEPAGLVADMAVLVGRHVPGRRGLARRGHTIMAGCAVIDDAAMIEGRAGKRSGVVAHRAVLRGRQVTVGFTGGLGAVMAGGAVIGDALVIEGRRQE